MKDKKQIIGFNFLHTHPKMERTLNVPEDHVIVDKKDHEKLLEMVNKRKLIIDIN